MTHDKNLNSINNLVLPQVAGRRAGDGRAPSRLRQVQALEKKLLRAGPVGPEALFIAMVVQQAEQQPGRVGPILRILPTQLKRQLNRGTWSAQEARLLAAPGLPQTEVAAYFAGSLNFPSLLRLLPFAVAQKLLQARGEAIAEFFKSWSDSIHANAKADKEAAQRAQKAGQQVQRANRTRVARQQAERAAALAATEVAWSAQNDTFVAAVTVSAMAGASFVSPDAELPVSWTPTALARRVEIPAEMLRPAPLAPVERTELSVNVRHGKRPGV